MSRLRSSRPSPLALTAIAAAAGAALTLLIAWLVLGREDAAHLIAPLAVSVVATVAVTAVAIRRLAGASLRVRIGAVAILAALIAIANLSVLAWLMLVSEEDALLIGVLLVYAAAAAIGAGVGTAQESSDAVERLSAVSRRIADGDLAARAGNVGGGAELRSLGDSLDEMAERLEQSIGAARETDQRRRDLVVAVSHDLRTPLAGLRALTEAIADDVVTDPDTVAAYTERMLESVESLSRLVDDLFEFVQLDSAAIEAETKRALLAEVVDSAVAACDAQAAEKGLELRLSLGDAARASCSPRLTRVVQNLLQNAIRHTPPDGTVTLTARQEGDDLELTVADSGEGIDEAALERVFEPFWRGDPSRSADGTGLGLALAKRIVEALGGRIEVDSAPLQGSRFAVVLPASARS